MESKGESLSKNQQKDEISKIIGENLAGELIPIIERYRKINRTEDLQRLKDALKYLKKVKIVFDSLRNTNHPFDDILEQSFRLIQFNEDFEFKERPTIENSIMNIESSLNLAISQLSRKGRGFKRRSEAGEIEYFRTKMDRRKVNYHLIKAVETFCESRKISIAKSSNSPFIKVLSIALYENSFDTDKAKKAYLDQKEVVGVVQVGDPPPKDF